MTPRLLCAAALAALCHLPVCAGAAAPPAETQADLTQAPRMGTWGFDLSGRDAAVKAGVDFYRHSNGAWDARTAIPSDRSEYGVFETLADLSRARSRTIIEKAAALAATKPEARQVGAMYQSFMDEKRIAALGKKPLAADLETVKAAKSKEDIAALMGASQKGFGAGFFGMYIGQHAKQPERYVTYLNQGGLGLPDRDYYLTPQFIAKKAAYEKYVAKMLGLAGWPQAAKQAAAIVQIETEIALVSWTRVEQRDAVKTWNPVTRESLAALAPGFPWEAFFKAADLPAVKDFVIGEPSAFTRIGEIFALTPLDTLQAWCAFNVVDQAAKFLPRPSTGRASSSGTRRSRASPSRSPAGSAA